MGCAASVNANIQSPGNLNPPSTNTGVATGPRGALPTRRIMFVPPYIHGNAITQVLLQYFHFILIFFHNKYSNIG